MTLFYVYAVVGLFGAVVGSFLNVCIYRIPLGKNIVSPPSHCPGCDTPILWRNNVPVFGWLLLKGRCRHCGEPISILYPLVELISALLAIWTVYNFGLRWESLGFIIFGYALLVLSMIDLEHYILPNVITYPGMLAGLLFAAAPGLGAPVPDFTAALWGLAVGGGGLWLFAWVFGRITGKEGMGLGDVKLLGMIGAWLGWQSLPFALFVAALVGSVVGIVWMVVAQRNKNMPIPFGPYLAGAAWLYLFYGNQAYTWYFNLMG